MIIAIDGPSGAGKSTVADELAKKLGFSHLDTGAMFRAVACLALQKGVSVDDGKSLADLAINNKISFKKNDDNEFVDEVFIGEQNVTTYLRTPEVNKAVTPVCKHKEVREELLLQQQKIAKSGNYILDGRDIGTVVFPDAELKIFLIADPEVRAKRRIIQLEQSGKKDYDYDTVLSEIKRRDYEDSHREHAPLKKADDAVEVDSSNCTKEEVVEKIYKLAKDRMN